VKEQNGSDFVVCRTGGPVGISPPAKGAGEARCEQCVESDKKIDHYRQMASRMTDQPLLDGIKELVERMQAQKVALHLEQGQ
jgi:beta-phosphoglucomutase-like phosphatase (HAD superfamily)